tara:strand:- start:447 stop:692 length:246 start_codon:yes stop_codon:yes gene_type:complete
LSPSVFLIKQLHEKAGVADGWDRRRVKRCAKFLNVTLEELSARSCIPHSLLRSWLQKGKVPSYIALLFYLQEKAELDARYD